MPGLYIQLWAKIQVITRVLDFLAKIKYSICSYQALPLRSSAYNPPLLSVSICFPSCVNGEHHQCLLQWSYWVS